MNPRLAHLLVCLYPRDWRERYGEEFEALLLASRHGMGTPFNVAKSALLEHIFPIGGRKMDQNPRSFGAIVRQPTAFLPMAMSLTALAVVLGHIAFVGTAGEPDEGAEAHIWQLLMAGQLPVLLFFAIKWLPRAPKQSLYVLALQVGAALSAMAPVFILNW
jgi:hypothetical protein